MSRRPAGASLSGVGAHGGAQGQREADGQIGEADGGDAEGGPGDGLERQFDREVEMRGDERPAALNDFAPVGLEGVGGVVEAAEDGQVR